MGHGTGGRVHAAQRQRLGDGRDGTCGNVARRHGRFARGEGAGLVEGGSFNGGQAFKRRAILEQNAVGEEARGR
jgi:hypothetical protein